MLAPFAGVKYATLRAAHAHAGGVGGHYIHEVLEGTEVMSRMPAAAGPSAASAAVRARALSVIAEREYAAMAKRVEEEVCGGDFVRAPLDVRSASRQLSVGVSPHVSSQHRLF